MNHKILRSKHMLRESTSCPKPVLSCWKIIADRPGSNDWIYNQSAAIRYQIITSDIYPEPEAILEETIFQLHQYLVVINRSILHRSRQITRDTRATPYVLKTTAGFWSLMEFYMEKLFDSRHGPAPEFLRERLFKANIERRKQLEYRTWNV